MDQWKGCSFKYFKNAQENRRCFNLLLIISKKKLLENDGDFEKLGLVAKVWELSVNNWQ